MRKHETNFIDTSALLYDPDIFNVLKSKIVIHTAVIKELDGHKRNDDKVISMTARKIARLLDKWGNYEGVGNYKSLAEGVDIGAGKTIIVYPLYDDIDALDSVADNKIVGGAVKWQRENPEDKVIIVTQDINMRNVARAYNLKAKLYPSYLAKIPEPALEASNVIKQNTPTPGLIIARLEGTKAKARVSYTERFFGFLGKFKNKVQVNKATVTEPFRYKTEEERLFYEMPFDDFKLATDLNRIREEINSS